MIEKISNLISTKIAEELMYDDEKKSVINYGVFAFIQMTAAIIVTMIVGAILGVFVEALIISFVIAILRKSSGGVHASTPIKCIVIGAIISCFGSLICKNTDVSKAGILICIIISFLYSLVIIIKYSPCDSKAKPITKKDKRDELKRLSIITIVFYFIIVCVFFVLYVMYNTNKLDTYALCILFGVVWQSFTLTKAAHRIFK